MTISEKGRRYLEGTGETRVRDELARDVLYPNATNAEAEEWLEEIQMRRLAIATEPGLRVARQARTAAWAAVGVAAIGVAATIVLALLTRH